MAQKEMMLRLIFCNKIVGHFVFRPWSPPHFHKGCSYLDTDMKEIDITDNVLSICNNDSFELGVKVRNVQYFEGDSGTILHCSGTKRKIEIQFDGVKFVFVERLPEEKGGNYTFDFDEYKDVFTKTGTIHDADNYYTLERAPEYIYLQNGAIVHQSIFDKNFDGNLKLLLSVVEDNIIDYATMDTHGYIGEKIDWSMVFDDYYTAIEARNDNESPA